MRYNGYVLAGSLEAAALPQPKDVVAAVKAVLNVK